MTLAPVPNHPNRPAILSSLRFRLPSRLPLFLLLLLPIPLYLSTHLLAHHPPPPPTCASPPSPKITLPRSTSQFPFLHSYLSTHHSNYLCLTSPTCHPKPPLLLWHCPSHDPSSCAGVGDRFRGIIFALLLSIAINRTFLLSWPTAPFPLVSALHPRHLNWLPPPPLLASLSSSPPPTLTWFQCDPPRPCTFHGRMPNISHLPPPTPSLPDINLAADNLPAILAPFPNLTISTRLEYTSLPAFLRNPHILAALPDLRSVNLSEHLVPLLRQLMAALFQSSPEVAALMAYHKFPFSRSYTGIHARTGMDMAEAANPRFRYVSQHVPQSARKLLDCVDKMRGGVIAPRVYVATDSEEMKRALKEEGGKRGVQVRYADDKALHFGINLRAVNKIDTEEKCRMFLYVFVDLMMLGGSDGMVVTGSGFANAAYLMGEIGGMVRLELNEEERCQVGVRGIQVFEY